MGQITATLVKELREKTGAGMMDCKRALSETDANLEEAVDWLRKKGLSAAEKKSGRIASEGLVAVHVNGNEGAIVEVNAETDFVARNELFQDFVGNISTLGINHQNIDELANEKYTTGTRTVQEELTHLIATIGENMNLRRLQKISVSNGVVASYIHIPEKEGMGKIGVLVALESPAGDNESLKTLGKQIAMHIAAARPQFLNIDMVDADALNRERDILSEQARASGKPEEIIEKMVEGRLRKFYEEVVLLEQIFVIDGESKIKTVIEKAAKDLGQAVNLAAYARFELGEGLEKKEENFAEEVAQAIGQ